jgi:RNA polymerase sigma-54 factor
MVQGLHLSQKMALSQVLAPQLQQSLELLQAPMMELKAMVEQELQQNPVLEEVPVTDINQEQKDGSEDTDKSFDLSEPPADTNYDPATEKESNEPVDDFQAEFEKLTQIDQEWRDHFSQANVRFRESQEDEERRQFMIDSLVAEVSLQEHLLEQVRLSDLTKDQWSIAEMIIGNIDDYGYLKASSDELAFATSITSESIQEVIEVIQSFHPPGVAARDLRECLKLQLERYGQTDSIEYQIVDKHIEALGKRRLPEIARGLNCSMKEIQAAIVRIGHLEPHPGRDFLPDNQQYISPEVFVSKVDDEYVVTTNNDYIPHLRISNTYKDIMSKSDGETEVRDYIRDKIRAGKFLIKSIHQRQQTILNIATEIVNRQREFMKRGIMHLKPLTMVQVAEAVGVHETTVSRAVAGKYMETPQGIFEMKYFFTSGIQTSNGEGVSNTSIKDMISAMVKKEDSNKPLSDEEIVKNLAKKDIVIARRTVAKYRSELNILPSHLRKVY